MVVDGSVELDDLATVVLVVHRHRGQLRRGLTDRGSVDQILKTVRRRKIKNKELLQEIKNIERVYIG